MRSGAPFGRQADHVADLGDQLAWPDGIKFNEFVGLPLHDYDYRVAGMVAAIDDGDLRDAIRRACRRRRASRNAKGNGREH